MEAWVAPNGHAHTLARISRPPTLGWLNLVVMGKLRRFYDYICWTTSKAIGRVDRRSQTRVPQPMRKFGEINQADSIMHAGVRSALRVGD